jgi:hexokinase
MAVKNISSLLLPQRLEEAFRVTSAELWAIIKDFHAEMGRGLSGRGSSLKMIPSYVDTPTGSEKGLFMALDLGGTNLRVLEVELKGGGKMSVRRVHKFVLGKHTKGSGADFFDFIASCVRKFAGKQARRQRQARQLGFTFSFPVEQTGIATGKLVRWTKGFSASGVEGHDVVTLLNEALARAGMANVAVAALTNDTVGTLVARRYADPACDVGVILGTGTNACYTERLEDILRWSGPATRSGRMIINIEWGNFNKLRQTSYDMQLDGSSANPRAQILEKMVSGMYLGEVARLVCRDLISRGILLAGSGIMAAPGSLKAEHVSRIEADHSKDLSAVLAVLKGLGIRRSSLYDRQVLKAACGIVSTRAARLSAAALAAVVTKTDPGLSRRHTIAIDGSVYEKHPGFSKRMEGTLHELFGKKASRLTMMLTKDGSGKGAAVIAAVASSL